MAQHNIPSTPVSIGAGPDLIPAIRTSAIAEGGCAEPLLSASRPAALAVALLPVRRLGVVGRGLGADIRSDTDVVGGVGLAPDVAWDAGVGAISAAAGLDTAGGGGVVGRGLRARRWRDADVVAGEGLAPNIAWTKHGLIGPWRYVPWMQVSGP
jgi:hypothetical protein